MWPLVFLFLLFQLPLPCQPLPSSKTTMTKNDIVDRTEDSQETALAAIDFLSAPDKELDLRELGIDVADDPTLGNKTEGDIAIPNIRKFMDETMGLARNSIRQPYRKWPNNEIPYALSSQYGAYSRSIIAKAMNEYHTKTCIRFIARDPRRHNDYVYIHPDDGCYSLGHAKKKLNAICYLVGRVGGRQPLSLDSGCIQVGTIVHEVGFFHEQSRYDRDQYIDIVWTNVVNGADDQFEKYGNILLKLRSSNNCFFGVNVINQLNEPYDYSSIMHYGPYAFSQNGRKTIVPRRAGAQKMGQRVQFSDIDLRKINKLYHCGLASVASTNSVVDSGRMHGFAPPSSQHIRQRPPATQPRRTWLPPNWRRG